MIEIDHHTYPSLSGVNAVADLYSVLMMSVIFCLFFVCVFVCAEL